MNGFWRDFHAVDSQNIQQNETFWGKLAHYIAVFSVQVVMALLLASGASAATTVKYNIVADSGTALGGSEGSTNLPAGNNTSRVSRTLFSTTVPSGLTTGMVYQDPTQRTFYTLGYVYTPVYASATVLSNATAKVYVTTSTGQTDRWTFKLLDYDPSAGTKTQIPGAVTPTPGYLTASSTTPVLLTQTFTITGTTYTIPAGHRLVLEIDYYSRSNTTIPSVVLGTGTVSCNSSTYNSYLQIDEGPPAPVTHTITASAGTGGTISPSGAVTVLDGASQTFTFTPNATYYISAVTVNGVPQGTPNSYTFNNVTTDPNTISVSFIQKFTVTPSAGTGGTIVPSSPQLVNAGSSLGFTITPNSGYQIQDVQVNGTSVTPVNSYTISNISSDTTINAYFNATPSPINNYTVTPPYIATPVPPNVMIMLSVETPMQGSAYADIACGTTAGVYGCTNSASSVGGRYVASDFTPGTTYTGYFDPWKCYSYSGSGATGLFTPYSTTTTQTCDGTKWSGNFLNWANTMAVDSFRLAFTGGNRDTDTGGSTPSTIVLAGRQTLGTGDSWFPMKQVPQTTSSLYIPFPNGNYWIVRHGNGFSVCSATTCTVRPASTTAGFPTTTGTTGVVTGGAYSLRIKVCDPTQGLETFCNSSNNKPEGILQQYQNQMRFGLISYAMKSNTDATRDGGIIRANMKWIQPTIPNNFAYYDSTGAKVTCSTASGCTNPEAELNSDGTFVSNPDGAPSGYNSGLINYINNFGYANGYKSYDPISEMYYQIVRYFQNKLPTDVNYCNGIGTTDDGFAAYCDTQYKWDKASHPWGWRDPYIYKCSQGAVVGVQDANPWLDKRIPGTFFTGAYGGAFSDYGSPDSDETGLNVTDWTNKVGNYEGLTPGCMNVGCEWNGTAACPNIDAYNGNSYSGHDSRCTDTTQKYVTHLGQVVGTAPYAPKENSYYIAGLAYYAHMTELRPDLNYCSVHTSTGCSVKADCPSGEECVITGHRTLTSYFIDTQEPNSTMLVGRNNMLWLAAKFGGFTDSDGDGKPYTDNTCGTGTSSNPKCAEWNSDGTGTPDTYMFANNPAQVAVGLNRSFNDILRRLSSGTAASILNNSQGSGASLLQAVFYPLKNFDSNTNASWIGELQNLWYYIDPYFTGNSVREDTVADQKLNLQDDYVVNFYFDQTQNQTQVLRQDDDGSGNYTTIDTVTPDEVKSLWRAGKTLLSTSPGSRTIKTVIPSGGVDTMIDFSTGNSSNLTLQSYMDVTSSQANSIIDYVTGTDYPRSGNASDPVYRNRTVTINTPSPAVTGVWKLGDIISSTPKIQPSIPLNAYASPAPSGYNDVSYSLFTDSYEYATRGTAYVGGNDGMLHAFKLGILDVRLSNVTGTYSKARLIGTNLGTEQWAFIPKNALPYLRYLADTGYGHVYYVDGTPTIVDASFNNYCSQTNYWDCPRQTAYLQSGGVNVTGNTGIPVDPTQSPSVATQFIQKNKLDLTNSSWRTVVIAGMGLGGASHDSTESCTTGTATSACVKTPVSGVGYSSYFALDVTNPASPQYLWEFSGDHANVDPTQNHYLGYTTPGPAIVRIGSYTNNGRWFAVFASGPMGPIDTSTHQFIGTSDQKLYVFVVDLATGALIRTIDTGVTSAFAGSLTTSVIDADRWSQGGSGSYSDDAIYIGYTQLDSSSGTWTKGGVIRILTKEDTNPANWVVGTLINNIGPVTTSVTKLQDRANKNLWVYFGTGRYFYKSVSSPDDSGGQRILYGVKDPCYSHTPDKTPVGTGQTNAFEKSCTLSAIDGTNRSTTTGSCSSGKLCNQTGNASTASATSIPSDALGWYISLDCTGTACDGTALSDGFMSERVITDPVASPAGAVFFTTFRPTTDVCGFGGNSYVWAVKYDTGGEPPAAAIQGKALLQVSTGAFAQLSLSTALSGQTDLGKNKRRTKNPIQGVPPRASGLSLIVNPKPTKRILHVQEK